MNYASSLSLRVRLIWSVLYITEAAECGTDLHWAKVRFEAFTRMLHADTVSWCWPWRLLVCGHKAGTFTGQALPQLRTPGCCGYLCHPIALLF